MKALLFNGDSRKQIRGFPALAKQKAGYQLEKVQRGEQPDDFKPMPTIGRGVEELRIASPDGAFRVVYYARHENAVYVLHAFQKHTQKTRKADLDLATARYRKVIQENAPQAHPRGL